MIEPLFYSVFLRKGTWARVYVNDMPLYKDRRPNAVSESYGFNELLVPGENAVSYEVLKAPDLSHIPDPAGQWTFRAQIYRQTDAFDESKSIEDVPEFEVLHQAVFPELYQQVEEPFRRLPFHFRSTFDCPFDDLPEPIWRSAPTCEFESEGTAELRDAVQRLHRAIVMQDADAFLEETALKRQHERGAYDNAAYEGDQAQAIRDFFATDPEVDDLDFDQLAFRRLHEGRVAHVTRIDDGYALQVSAAKDPERTIQTDLLLTQHQGRWRIFA